MEKPEKLFSVKNKVVLITGGAGFLGMEYATFLARAGARVILFDRGDQSILQRKAAEIVRNGWRTPFVYSVDITDEHAVREAVRAVLRRTKRIDVLVNNAAMNPIPGTEGSRKQFSPYEKYPLELWSAEIAVGLTGAFIVTKAVIPAMKRQRSGTIVNIGSVYGEVAPDNRIYKNGRYKSIAYATVKGAVPNFTRTLASYLAPRGIRVNSLTLGGAYNLQDKTFVKKYSVRTMLGRMASKEDFNGALLFLVSDASRYMTGANLVIDGGWTAW